MHVLPQCVIEYVELVVKKVRYRRRVRQEVMAELLDHFTDALRDIENEQERQAAAQRLIETFGDPKLLAQLIRRGKKRCRPLWKRVLLRTLQATPVLLVLFIIYGFWFVHGSPTIRIDYVQRANDAKRPIVTAADNGWPHYTAAIEAYVAPDEELAELVNDLKRNDWGAHTEQIRRWLQDNAPAWREFEKGSRMPHAWFEYAPTDDGLYMVLLPELGPLRRLGKVGLWQARLKGTDGRQAEAFDDCMTVARVGRHLLGRGSLIEQLVGMGIGRLVWPEMLRLVSEHKFAQPDLQQMQAALEELFAAGYPPVDMSMEKMMQTDLLQRCFTDGGVGGGHLLPNRFSGLDDHWDLGYARISGKMGSDSPEAFLFVGATMLHARRDETERKLAEYWQLYDERTTLTPYEFKTSGLPTLDDWIGALPRPKYLFIQTLVPALGRVGELDHRHRTLRQATLTVLALQRRRLAEGKYPAELPALVDEGYLQAVPDDPYAAGALRYERQGDTFVLYSLGADYDDDGGTETPDSDWGRKADGGDRVFWPVRTE